MYDVPAIAGHKVGGVGLEVDDPDLVVEKAAGRFHVARKDVVHGQRAVVRPVGGGRHPPAQQSSTGLRRVSGDTPHLQRCVKGTPVILSRIRKYVR